MTEKNIKDISISNIHDKDDASVGDELKKRIGSRLPEGVDISSIGNIDLYEAEKIATEEIVFLTEDDLIEGLEDFELVPLKNDDFYSEKSEEPEKRKNETTESKIKTISSEPGTDEISDEPDELKDKIPETEPPEEVVEEPPAELNIQTPDRTDSDIETALESENVPEIKKTGELSVEADSPSNEIYDLEAEDNDLVSGDNEDFTEAVPGRITENSINIQFEEIFSETETGDENIPARFQNDSLTKDVKFIDDLKVSRSSRSFSGYSEDPLTERLARIIHVSDTPMSVITERSDYYDDHAYLLEDTTLYEKGAAAESEEIFYDDPDFDFFEHAIVKNDFSRFIQEIDDYYDIEKIESESQISEILGLNSEEREIITDELFSGYYSNIDFDSEIDFLNPNLDFINRSYIESKDVSYLIDNPDSLFEDERISIEDDITARSAIVFEEDVEDLKLLMERDYGTTARERIENDITLDSGLREEIEVVEPVPEQGEIEIEEDSPAIIDITDHVIILEDKENVDAFTNQFPEKKEDLARLLSYLDGLFEKLPEEAVKKFAQSEYFDLYVKVMNEIGT